MSPPPSTSARFELFASTAPGLESMAAGELKALGVRGRQEIGGVAFSGGLDRIYNANLWLRTASRIVARLGRFHASTFYELERRSKKLPWVDFLPEAGSIEVRVTCRKSKLYHSDAVAERVLSVIGRMAPPGIELRVADDHQESNENEDEKSGGSTQLFVVRIVHDECEISADTSGELLHRRGYRTEIAKAPLRETLAAAMVLASGWRPNEPIIDPMCGSGAIPIEAALFARRIAPGANRRFQFMNWPNFDAGLWKEIIDGARSGAIDARLDIRGSDRDAGAISSATRNAERAGVVADIRFAVSSLSGSIAELADVPDGEGWILTNPPYGIRVGERGDLRDLYATLGANLRNKQGWRLGVLTTDRALAGQMRLPLRSRFDSRNGGIPVSFLVCEKPNVKEARTTGHDAQRRETGKGRVRAD
ncbi:MAG: class I SAM-dependent RNA methyltransferase [Gemmatimonadetes bacterium]|nr:MAG: class I SAM-dependent RNA methyltransferase [Gemmatimonadota bacterium]